MDVLQLNYFRIVAREGSYKKAADLLFISRQGLMKSIRNLEEEIGEKLFEVSSSGVRLTDFGNELYLSADEYIRYHQNFLQKISALKSEKTGHLAIGVQTGFTEGFGKNFLADFIIRHSDVNVILRSYDGEKIKSAMKSEDIPVWICTGKYDVSEFEPLHTQTNPMFVIMSEHHPLAGRPSVSLADIRQYPVIGLAADIGQKGMTDEMINNLRMRAIDYSLTAADRNTIMKLVQSGSAISFNAGWHYKEYDGIVAKPISDLHVEIKLHILLARHKKGRYQIEPFLQYIKEVLKK